MIHDDEFHFEGMGGSPSVCRVRIYDHKSVHGFPVVVLSDLASNDGTCVQLAAEYLANELTRVLTLPLSCAWIEHHPADVRNPKANPEQFFAIGFTYLLAGRPNPHVGPRWRRMDKANVEQMIGEKWRP